MFAAEEGLPKQQQAQVSEQQRARPLVRGAAQHRDVQQREHRDHDEAPMTLGQAPGDAGKPGVG